MPSFTVKIISRELIWRYNWYMRAINGSNALRKSIFALEALHYSVIHHPEEMLYTLVATLYTKHADYSYHNTN